MAEKVYYYFGIRITKKYGHMVDDKPGTPNHYYYQTSIPGGHEYYSGNYQHKTLAAAKEQVKRHANRNRPKYPLRSRRIG